MDLRSKTFQPAALAAAISLATVGMAAVTTGASAADAEWTIAPRIEIQTGHDSNLRMARQAEDAVLETSALTSVVAKRRTETSDISLTGGYNLIKYGNEADSISDRDQQFAQGVYRKRWTRWGIGLSGGFRRDDLLRTIDGLSLDSGNELDAGAGEPLQPDDAPLDDLADDGTGSAGFDVEEQVRRLFVRGAAYAQYELTERDRIRVGYSYAERDFSAGGLVIDIRDSKRHSIDAQYARDVSQRSVLLVTLNASELETENAALNTANSNVKADFYQGLVGWRARLDEKTRIEIGAGISYIDAEGNTDTGFLVRGRATTRVGKGKLTGEVRRSLVPNAFGNVAETDLFRLNYSRAINERLSMGLTTSGQFRERGAEDQRTDRDLVRAGINASWALTPEWSLTSNYDFAWVDRKGDIIANPGSTEGHRVTFGIAWAPKTTRIGQ